MQGGSEHWDVLTAEMKRYEYEISPAGQIPYGAPAGYHDDCVMALALANHGRWEQETCGSMAVLTGSGRQKTGRWMRERALMG